MKLEEDSLKCHKCGKWAAPTSLDFRGFRVRGWECECGEKYINPVDAEKIFAVNKLLRKEKLVARIAKVGNSFVFRVPKELVTALGLKASGTLEIKVVGRNRICFSIPA